MANPVITDVDFGQGTGSRSITVPVDNPALVVELTVENNLTVTSALSVVWFPDGGTAQPLVRAKQDINPPDPLNPGPEGVRMYATDIWVNSGPPLTPGSGTVQVVFPSAPTSLHWAAIAISGARQGTPLDSIAGAIDNDNASITTDITTVVDDVLLLSAVTYHTQIADIAPTSPGGSNTTWISPILGGLHRGGGSDFDAGAGLTTHTVTWFRSGFGNLSSTALSVIAIAPPPIDLTPDPDPIDAGITFPYPFDIPTLLSTTEGWVPDALLAGGPQAPQVRQFPDARLFVRGSEDETANIEGGFFEHLHTELGTHALPAGPPIRHGLTIGQSSQVGLTLGAILIIFSVIFNHTHEPDNSESGDEQHTNQDSTAVIEPRENTPRRYDLLPIISLGTQKLPPDALMWWDNPNETPTDFFLHDGTNGTSGDSRDRFIRFTSVAAELNTVGGFDGGTHNTTCVHVQDPHTPADGTTDSSADFRVPVFIPSAFGSFPHADHIHPAGNFTPDTATNQPANFNANDADSQPEFVKLALLQNKSGAYKKEVGMIGLFSGPSPTIPPEWLHMNGNNIVIDTVDTRGKFVKSAASLVEIGSLGGAPQHTPTMADHTNIADPHSGHTGTVGDSTPFFNGLTVGLIPTSTHPHSDHSVTVLPATNTNGIAPGASINVQPNDPATNDPVNLSRHFIKYGGSAAVRRLPLLGAG